MRYWFVFFVIFPAGSSRCKFKKRKSLEWWLFFVEGGGLEENGVGEEPEEDRAAQPGALHGQTFLQPGHEPLWRHGKTTVTTH